MTYNDPNTHNRPNGVGQPKNNRGWIIGGIALLAAVFVIISMYRHNGNYNPSAMNTPAITTNAPETGTTGSAPPTVPTSR